MTVAERALRVVLALALLGAARTAHLHGTPLSSVLWHDLGWPEPAFVAVDRAGAVLSVLAAGAALAARGRGLAWAMGLVAAWHAAVALATAWDAGGFAPYLAPFGQAPRFLLPAALALWATRPRRARRLLLLATVFVFAAHGVEALLGHPRFIDYLIRSADRLVAWSMTEATAGVLLWGIGALDVAVAAWVAARPQRPVLAYACAWGMLTASMRLVYFGLDAGAHHALIRAGNGGAALVLLLARGWARAPEAPKAKPREVLHAQP